MNIEVGICGVYCGYCPVFKREEKRCLGCEWVNKQLRLSRESHKGCAFWECAKEKNIKCCFLCEKFPCQLHYGKEAVYTPETLQMWKELIEQGFIFSKQ
ncbi:DUF3795 domain-containing protein [Candidatus Bathyarchaeota archaeon]|nr:DUF3795 domain-containing protein [Candidatus Bathyarchaeota archaeon]MCK4434900.1 DUF3795 domain-containing protein [Candidatus Bathyarchaeota archaeon]